MEIVAADVRKRIPREWMMQNSASLPRRLPAYAFPYTLLANHAVEFRVERATGVLSGDPPDSRAHHARTEG